MGAVLLLQQDAGVSSLLANPPGKAFRRGSGLGRAATTVTKKARNDIILLIQRVTARQKATENKVQGKERQEITNVPSRSQVPR